MSQRMNWHISESQDNSICPRRIPPTGHGMNSVPRMQPQVPEVSMYVPSTQGSQNPYDGILSIEPRYPVQHNERISTIKKNCHDHSLGSVRAPIEVPKHSQPLTALKRPTSELSLMFHDTLDLSVSKVDTHEDNVFFQAQSNPGAAIPTVEKRGNGKFQDDACCQTSEILSYKMPELRAVSDLSNKPPEMNAFSYLPPDVASHIRWQTQQILLLQRQVQQLSELITGESPNVKAGRVSENGSFSSRNSEKNVEIPINYLSQKKSNISASLELPSTSIEREAHSRPDSHCSQKHQENGREPAQGTPLEELSFCSSLNALQGDIQCDRDVIPPDNIDEIMNKETSSRYIEDRASSQKFRQTLGSLQDVIQYDRDVIPPENIHKIMSNDPTEIQGTSEDNCSTLARLREMGVSFVRKEDLLNVSRSSQPPPDSTLMFYPKAADSMGDPSLVTSTSEYSLLLNSAALKYLNDAQLATTAIRYLNDSQIPTSMRNSPKITNHQ